MVDGEEIEIPSMSDSHVINAIRYVKKLAKEGMEIVHGGGFIDGDDMWGDVDIIKGREVFSYFDNYYKLVAEARRRGIYQFVKLKGSENKGDYE